MSLLWKRYYFLRIILGFILVGLVFIGSTRIFSYNFGQAINSNVSSKKNIKNIKNLIDPFDDSIVHDIQIDMSDSLYQKMLETYTELGEKEFFSVSVVIDGVEISNVGVRLKGNSSLRGLGGGKNGGFGGGGRGGFSGGADRGFGNMDYLRGNFPGGEVFSGAISGNRENSGSQLSPITSGFDSKTSRLETNFSRGGDNPGESFGIKNSSEAVNSPEIMSGNAGFIGGTAREFVARMGNSSTGYLPLMLKFDEFVEGQTYNGLSELSLRVGGFGDQTLLAEMLAYRIYQEFGYPAPNTSYTQVKVGNLDPQIYVLSELVNKEYIDYYYPGDDGILYKNKSFYSFDYLGEDPTEYAEIFSQKTNKKKDDFSQLIKLIKFINQSSDEDFDEELDTYIDVESILYLMAIDSIIQNTDGFNNGRMNYYLYYNKGEKRFKILTWDQNLAFGGFGGGAFPGVDRQGVSHDFGSPISLEEIFSGELNIAEIEKKIPGFQNGLEQLENARKRGNGGMGKNGFGSSGGNNFRSRLLKSEKYNSKYQEIFEKVHSLIYEEDFLDTQIISLSTIFSKWNKEKNLISQQLYQQGIENLQNTIKNRESATASSDISQSQTALKIKK